MIVQSGLIRFSDSEKMTSQRKNNDFGNITRLHTVSRLEVLIWVRMWDYIMCVQEDMFWYVHYPGHILVSNRRYMYVQIIHTVVGQYYSNTLLRCDMQNKLSESTDIHDL